MLLPALLGASRRAGELVELDIEELLKLEVTSASKKPERRLDVAEAIHVLTSDDIRRSGATSIAEVLRLVPGVHVARVDSDKWAIGIRGFASTLARSVLVLIDGRMVYNPLFAGTYWELQDTVLDDIDRIEVIRGPGGTLWGANAFNGVINIITKDAAETQGGMLTGRGGSEEHGTGIFRYGGAIGEKLHYRAYAKYFNRDGGDADGEDYDDWRMARGGFRADWRPQERDRLTLQGDIYDGDLGTRVRITEFTPPFQRLLVGESEVSGGNILGRWTRDLGRSASASLMTYYDHTFRRDLHFREERDTFEVDGQHSFLLPWRQEVIWGATYRLTADDTSGVPGISFVPSDSTDHLVSAFLQDAIALLPRRLRLTLGSKFEHNDYSGFEVQPNARLLWTPVADQTFWAAVGRSVRTPSRTEHDVQLTIGPPLNLDPSRPDQCLPAGSPCLFPRVVGDRDFDSEKMLAYQIGHRWQVTSFLLLDSVFFYQRYEDLLSVEPRQPFDEAFPSPPHSVLPLGIENNIDGESYGTEIAADTFFFDRWWLHGGYSLLFVNLHQSTSRSADASTVDSTEDLAPRHQAFVRSHLDLPAEIELDTTFRYVDNLSTRVRSYVTFDLRLAVPVTDWLELAAVGQNLWDSQHREFPGGTRVERSVYGQATYRW